MDKEAEEEAREGPRARRDGDAGAEAPDHPLLDTKGRGWMHCGIGCGVVAAVAIVAIVLLLHFIAKARHLASVAQPTLLLDKPKADTRTYQHTELQNGLEVLNIRDKRSNKAAFAVAVQAGSLDDPEGLPGLAHFCEHMLFLGTSRYPIPDDYRNFMGGHGGKHNAFTAGELTVYFGEVSSEAAAEAMDRFADFFRAPLFNTDYVQKEVHAIDSEHAKNVQSPLRRTFETMNALADPKSAVSRFHTGDLETLYNAPARVGVSPVSELKKFFRSFYCPSRMKLVTFGPSTLEEQLQTVHKEFDQLVQGSAECRSRDPQKAHATPQPWLQEAMGKWATMKGTQLQAELWLLFPLPDVRKNFRSQPLEYVNHVLTYGGENSLKRVLSDSLELISSLNVMTDFNGAGVSFMVTMKLTQSGREHPEVLLDVLYSYLAALRREGVDQGLYGTLADVLHLNWDWTQPVGAMDTVTDFAERMTNLPAASLLSGNSRIDSPEPALVVQLMDMLRPENMNAVLVDPDADDSPAFANNKVRTLPHYGVKYAVQDLEHVLGSGTLKRWNSWLDHIPESQIMKELISNVQAAGINVTYPPKLVLPTKISGIPKSIALDHMSAMANTTPEAMKEQGDLSLFGMPPLFGPRPSPLVNGTAELAAGAGATGGSAGRRRNESLDDVWYRSGWMTTSPEVKFKLTLRPLKLPAEPEPSALDVMRVGIYSRLLMEELAPKMFDLTMAGVSYDIDVSTGGLTVSFSGFAPILPNLGEKVLTGLDTFNKGGEVTPLERKRFARIKRKLNEDLQTYSKMPVSYAVEDLQLLLTRGSHSAREKLRALEEVTAESAKSSVIELLCSRQLQLTALVMGNLGEEEARSMTSSFTKLTDEACLSMAANASAAQRQLGQVEHVTPVVQIQQPVELRTTNPRKGDPNDAVVVSLVAGVSTVEQRVKLTLLGQILDPLAFNELRSQRQLGYVVQAGMTQFSNVLAIDCLVQSNVLRADDLEASIEFVLTKLMIERLHTLTAKEFSGYKDALKQLLLEPPAAYSEEVEFFWGPIAKGGQCFDLRGKMFRYLDGPDVTKEALIEEWTRLAMPDKGGSRRKVTVKYFAESVPDRLAEDAATQAWQKQGVVDNETLAMLKEEFGNTVILTSADAYSRGELVKQGGYFPTDLNCELAGTSEAALIRRQAALKQAETRPMGYSAGSGGGPQHTAFLQRRRIAGAGAGGGALSPDW